MRRYALLLIIVLSFTATTAAQTFNQNTTQLQPGEETTIGNLDVEDIPPTANGYDLSLGMPPAFETELWNTSWEDQEDENGTVTGRRFNGSINVTVPADYSPEQGTVDSTVSFTADSDQQDGESVVDTRQFQTDYEVPRVNNWTAEPENLTGSFNVGEEGEIIGVVNSTQQGNALSVNLDYNITGNVTQLVSDTEGSRTLYNGQDMPPIRVQTDIAEDQQWGEYSGTLNITDQEDNFKEIPININVTDVQSPEFLTVETPDVEATKTGDVTVLVDDNIGVTDLNGTVYKVGGENESDTEVQELEFENIEDDEEMWKAEFTETGNVSDYYAELEAFDGSGNNATERSDFRVVKLDTINITRQNFRMDTTRVADESVESEFLKVETDTPFNLTLSYFDHSQENASISVGVREEEEETDRTFTLDSEESKLEFEEAGTYYLQVSTNTPQSYEGTLNVEHIEEHVDVEEIFFEGLFINPDYLEPQSFSVGEFRGTIGYADPNATVKNRIRFEGTAPAENCEGVERWTDCITGFTMGEYENIEDERDDAQDKATLWFRVAAVSWVFLFVFIFLMIRKNQLKGTNYATPKKGLD